MPCPLCRAKGKNALCEECDLVLLATEVLYQIYSTGSVEDEANSIGRNFVREIGFTFNRDPRAKRYFAVADELIFKSMRDYLDTPVPVNQFEELKYRSQTQIDGIMKILEESHIARKVGDSVYLEEIGQRLAQLLPSGIDINSDIFRAAEEEMRGAICVVLASRLINGYLEDKKYDRPRNYLLNMKRITRHVSRFLRIDEPISPDTWDDEFFWGDTVQVGEKQRVKILMDMLNSALLIGAITREPGKGKKPSAFRLRWKDTVPPFQERLRERWRERERERGR